MQDSIMTLGERIRAARVDANLTQMAIAKALGIKRPSVTAWEKDKAKPSSGNLIKLAKFLNLQYSELIGEPEVEVSVSEGMIIGLPVRGAVAAGTWLVTPEKELEPIPVAPNPAYPAESQYGLIVQGNSTNLVIPDGEFAHVVDVLSAGLSIRDGDLVIIQQEDNGRYETTMKRLAKNGAGWLLLPESDDPEHAEPITYDGEDNGEITIKAVVIGKYKPISRGTR